MTIRRDIATTAEPLLGGVFCDLEAHARAQDGPVYPLHYGDSWRDPLAVAYDPLPKADLFKYAPACGEPGFLDTVIHRLEAKTGIRRDPGEVVAVSGATAGVRDVINALVDPGDEVILPAPFWPLVRGTVRSRGAVAVEVPFFTNLDDPAFDPEQALEAAVTERTVLLYLNTPHNPTGRVLSDAVLAAVARVAERHDLWVLCDEVYEEVYFADTAPPATWWRDDLLHRTVAVHSMSKSFAMAGARVGWAHGPKPAMKAIRAVHTYQDFGPAKSQQLIAARVLREGETWMAETRRLYAEAGRIVCETLGLPPIEGGTFAFVSLSGDAAPFLVRLARAGVLVTPGRVCGDDYADGFRFCFTVVPPADLKKALAIMEDSL